MRIYSYFFEGLFSLLLIALALVSWLSGRHTLNLLILPWKPATVRWVLLVAGVAGLVVVWLATRDLLRVTFLLWCVLVFAVLTRGFFFGWVHYVRGPFPLSWAVGLTLASLLAVGGAWVHYRNRRGAGY